MKAPRSAPTEARPYPRGVLKPSVRQLADLPIWILQSPTGRSLNCILISGPTGLVLVNTGVSHRHGAAISAAVSGLTDQPLNTIIYPHHPTTSCQGTTAVTDPDSVRSGAVVILAAGRPDSRQFPGMSPNFMIDQERILELAGLTMRLMPVSTGTVTGMNIYLPRHRVAIIADEPCMWAGEPGARPGRPGGAPFAKSVNWFLRLPVEHLLGSHLMPLSGTDVNLVLRTYLTRPRFANRTQRSQDD
jgi:hypothetical protein